MTDFTFQNGPNLETKSDRPGKSLAEQGIPHAQGFDAADANLVTGALASLRTGIVAGIWRRLVSYMTPPTSSAGEVVESSAAGVPMRSVNGRAAKPAWSGDTITYSASAGAWTPALHEHAHAELLLDADGTLNVPTVDEGAATVGGVRFEVKVTQDSTGYHALTLGAGFVGGARFMPRQGPGQVSTLSFKRSSAGTWYLHNFDGIDTGRALQVLDFGADPTFTADSTAALQAALNYFSGDTATHSPTVRRSGHLHFPLGHYKVSSTLEYAGTPGASLLLTGEGEGEYPFGSAITYTGPTTGNSRVFRFQGAYSLKMEHIRIDCGGARFGVQTEAFTKTYPTGFSAASHNTFRKLNIGGFRSFGSGLCAAFLVGAIPEELPAGTGTLQSDDTTFEECIVGGSASANPDDDSCSYLNLQGGNTKNFRIRGGVSAFVRTIAYSMGNSSTVHVDGHFAYGLTGASTAPNDDTNCAAFVRGGSVRMTACEMEGSSLTERARMYHGLGGTGINATSVIIDGCEYDAAAPADDLVVAGSGHIILSGNKFRNARTTTAIARVGGNVTSGQQCSITAFENFFQNATATEWLYDRGGNNMLRDNYAIEAGHPAVRAWNNWGGVDNGGGLPPTGTLRLQDVNSVSAEVLSAKLDGTQQDFVPGGLTGGASVDANGLPNAYAFKETVPFSVFKAGAAGGTSVVFDIGYLPPRAKLTNVQVEFGGSGQATAFAGNAGALTVNMGLANPPTGDVLQDTIVSGSTPTLSAKTQWGSLVGTEQPVNMTAYQVVRLKLSVASGTLNDLTAGKLSAIVEYRLVP